MVSSARTWGDVSSHLPRICGEPYGKSFQVANDVLTLVSMVGGRGERPLPPPSQICMGAIMRCWDWQSPGPGFRFYFKFIVLLWPGAFPSLGLRFASVHGTKRQDEVSILIVYSQIQVGRISVSHYTQRLDFLLLNTGLLIPAGSTSQGCQEYSRRVILVSVVLL